MNLNELLVYQLSMNIAEKIWCKVQDWEYFEKTTIGKQLVRAADSIAANIGEGFGRYYFKENRNFCYYSRGSLFETMIWLRKAYNRSLITKSDYKDLIFELKNLSVRLNNYINKLGPKTIV
jgi:four helix bundle protein